jgi:ribosomal protein L37AE/L43A
MGEGFSGENALWTIYLVVYLLAATTWLRSQRREVRQAREAKRRVEGSPSCPDCKTRAEPDTGPWGGWKCQACGSSVEPAPQIPAATGWRGWLERHSWAPIGALWATIVWSLLAFGGWWLHERGPALMTLPLAIAGGFVAGWLLSVTIGRD